MNTIFNVPEIITAHGPVDCLGNVGSITTEQDFYVRDIYAAAHRQWYAAKRKQRGTLTFCGNGDNRIAIFTPAT